MCSKVRLAVLASILAAALVPASTAAAQIDQFSLSPTVRLGPEGASATMVVTVQCTNGFSGAVEGSIVQNTGGRLASGGDLTYFGCTGMPQTISLSPTFFLFALKPGKATATATLNVFDPTTFEMSSTMVGPITVRVRK